MFQSKEEEREVDADMGECEEGSVQEQRGAEPVLWQGADEQGDYGEEDHRDDQDSVEHCSWRGARLLHDGEDLLSQREDSLRERETVDDSPTERREVEETQAPRR